MPLKKIYNMIFDINVTTLTIKARLIAGERRTHLPKESVYSSVVWRESVHLSFLAAALNKLDILAGNIQNTYINAPTKERVYIMCDRDWWLVVNSFTSPL